MLRWKQVLHHFMDVPSSEKQHALPQNYNPVVPTHNTTIWRPTWSPLEQTIVQSAPDMESAGTDSATIWRPIRWRQHGAQYGVRWNRQYYNLAPNMESAETDNTTIWRPTWSPLKQTILQSGAQHGVHWNRQHYNRRK
ncbi:hypothetical protein CDAR_240851 [Caerostris darwini]|uniref:Uncharacterized protein n=1 Tax=Caerostris darwini TaxID=1538125 RepID=A0AAV4TLL6_9ARAC|nr:hypothetical protein CDAR_240851 [Caerostris darwini]